MGDVSLGEKISSILDIYSRLRVVPLFALTVVRDAKERKKTWLRKIPGEEARERRDNRQSQRVWITHCSALPSFRALLAPGFRGAILSSRFTHGHAPRTKRKRNFLESAFSAFVDHQSDPAYARGQKELNISQSYLISFTSINFFICLFLWLFVPIRRSTSSLLLFCFFSTHSVHVILCFYSVFSFTFWWLGEGLALLFLLCSFMRSIQPIATKVPYMVLPGNHEVLPKRSCLTQTPFAMLSFSVYR